jgi:hypothetical protein
LLNLASAKIKIAAILILSLAIFGGGYKVAQWRYSAIIADINTELSEGARIAEKAAKEHADAVMSEYELIKAQQETVSKTITKEVIKYVQNPDAGKCAIPDAGVRLHDNAATAGMSSSTPVIDGSTGKIITDIELLNTVVDNYETCNAIRDRLTGLQDWARKAD